MVAVVTGRVFDAHGELPQGTEKEVAVEAMFDRIAPTYDRANRVISLGQDRRWRRRTIAALSVPRGSTVLDLACGTGDLCRDLEAVGQHPIGIDVSAGMLANARTLVPLVRADVLRLPVADGAVDGIVCGFALRNFVDLEAFFSECARVLRPGGRFAALDAAIPESAVMRAGHKVFFMGMVPVLGRIVAGDAEAYRYLPKSTAYLPPVEELLALAGRAGFISVARQTMTGGAVQLLTGTRT
ncbi:MAG: ubiquinone/menaquinone biosynthesis methyltransferase [Actinomycetia bacterium]|nr:ubiquinone/menaquinone biosynthesis methyltransferase [Actinomycetes bacterium]